MKTTLPPITHKQQEILTLLYTFRFLDRTHIQALLGHKNNRRILEWLKDLRDKSYVDWHYDANDFAAKTKPAIYYLSLNGIRHLRSLDIYPEPELRKRYKEPTRSQQFIERCLLIADCCIILRTQPNSGSSYAYITEADYIDPDHPSHSFYELRPHLFFTKQLDKEITDYLLEIVDPFLPRHQLRKRLKEYVEYLSSENWRDSLDQAPVILFACPSTADLLYIKRRIRKLLNDEDAEESDVRVTTIEKLRTEGIIGRIWEDV